MEKFYHKKMVVIVILTRFEHNFIRVHEILVQHPSNNISIVRLQRSRFKIVHLFRGKDKVFKAQGVQHL